MKARLGGAALVGAALLLYGADRLLAHVAVEMNAAGALLSPGGASLDAFAVAALFLLARFGWSLLVCVGFALTARALVKRVAPAAVLTTRMRSARGSRPGPGLGPPR